MLARLLPLLLLCFYSATAQTTYQPGYFTDNTGTKTECLIRNPNWLLNPESFDYRLTENGVSQSGSIKDAQEFGVGDYTYRRYTVLIDRSTNDVDRASVIKDPEYTTETLYLRQIATGEAVLYSYASTNFARFFAAKSGDEPQQLVYKPYKSDGGIAYNRNYRGQLYRIMKDKYPDNNTYKKIDYTAKDLVTVFNKYNGVTQTEPQAIKQDNGGKLHLRVYAGGHLATGSHNVTMTDETFTISTAIAPVAGMDFECVLPFNNNKWAVFVSPYFEAYKHTEVKPRQDGNTAPIYQYTSYVSLDYKSINLPLGVRYSMFFSGHSKFTLSAAFNYSLAAGISKARYERRNAIASNNFNYENPLTNSVTLILAGGYQYKDFGIETRYLPERRITTNYSAIVTKYGGFSVVLNYKVL
jgi:hypothetical protein